MQTVKFEKLGLSVKTLKSLEDMGFDEATPIQAKAIPIVMKGQDFIGQAQTGTGKTCAFGIPAVERINPDDKSVQVLVLCPTRELAMQVSQEVQKLCKHHKGVKTLAIYGGQVITKQITALKNKPQIIIGTPGRVMDHMKRRTLKLQNLKMLVLDEADEMLNMGFREDIDTICEQLPTLRQTILFSATMPKDIIKLTQLYMNNPKHLAIEQKSVTINTVEQFYLEVKESNKIELLCRLLDLGNIKSAMVFCNMKWKADSICEQLQERGYNAESLHGDMKQAERDRVMSKFRNGSANILVSTDVAARGIDVNGVEAVFNYDLPQDLEYYVHRIGRTGRAGKKGISYSFTYGRGMSKLREIEKYINLKLIKLKPPGIADLEKMKRQMVYREISATAGEKNLYKYKKIIEDLVDFSEDLTVMDIAAALFEMNYRHLEDSNYVFCELDEGFQTEPAPKKEKRNGAFTKSKSGKKKKKNIAMDIYRAKRRSKNYQTKKTGKNNRKKQKD